MATITSRLARVCLLLAGAFLGLGGCGEAPDGGVETRQHALHSEYASLDLSAGGWGGSPFAFSALGSTPESPPAGQDWRLTKITMLCGHVVDAIQFTWTDMNNPDDTFRSALRGGGGGSVVKEIHIDPGNPLRRIEALVGRYGNSPEPIIHMLTFFTGPGGDTLVGHCGTNVNKKNVTWFNLYAGTARSIEGFWGQSGKFLDRIGLYTYLP